MTPHLPYPARPPPPLCSPPTPSCHSGDHVLSEVLWRTGGLPVVPVRCLFVCLSEDKKVLMLRLAQKKVGVKRHFLFSAGPHGCPKVPQTHREVRFGPRVGSAAPSPGNSGGCPDRFFEIRFRLNDEILILSCGINERKILSK